MNKAKIRSYCKINLTLRILKKLRSGYHNISSLITFCDIYDEILISKIKGKKDKIKFFGKFKNGINSKTNTISKTLKLIRESKNLKFQCYKIDIKKNIPHGSGLGGGSSNAAHLLKYLNKTFKLSNNKIKILSSKVGFDVPICLENKNTFLTGKKNEVIRFKKKFNLNMLIVYPNLQCSTADIYKKNKGLSVKKKYNFHYLKNNTSLLYFLKNEKNDLEKTVIKIYPKIKKLIHFIEQQNGCYFSRITGSGSSCIGIFSSMKKATYAQKIIKLKYPKYWSVVSKTI